MSILNIPPISIGTWAFGDPYWGDQSHSDTLKTLHAAFRNSFTLFDTAPVYGKGKSEQILGQQIKGEHLISTKCFTKPYPQVKKSLEHSLKRLNRKYVDIFFIHWPSSKHDFAPVIEYLEKERERGRIRYIGLSNFNKNKLNRALNYGNIDIVQNPFNLFWIKDLDYFSYCKKKGITTQGYSPLAQGLLTGKYSGVSQYSPTDMRNHMVLYYPENLRILYPYIDKIKKIAESENISMTKLAIKWSLEKIESVVVGCRKRYQLEELVDIDNIKLSKSSINLLNEISLMVNRDIRDYKNIFNHNY